VILHAGGLLHAPIGVPSPVYDIAWWRDLLVVAALAAAWCEARGRRGSALVFAILFAVLAVGFWAAALARPYGVLVDGPTTIWAADVAVAGGSGGGDRFLAGEPGRGGFWPFLARHVRPDLVLLAPTILPVFVVPAIGLAIAWLWRRRDDAALAAILWLGAGTGGLETLRGLGFVPGLWSRPLTSLLWLATAAAVLAVGRVPLRWDRGAMLGTLAIVAWCLLGRRGPDVGVVETLLALTLDNHLWLLLGVAGLLRLRDPAACALAGGGAALSLIRALGGPGDAWAGASLCRLGLILATTGWIVAAVAAWADGLTVRRLERWRLSPSRAITAGLVATVLAGGFLAWWDPAHTDPIAKESLEPIPAALVTAMGWIRTATPPEAVVMADDEYAAAVSVLGERRVLRAPSLISAPDDERRLRLQRAVLAGRTPAALRQRYGLRYVLIAPGQFRAEAIAAPEDLDRIAFLRLVYANERGMRVYEIAGGDGRGEPIK
jgi:hypothetical protein